MSARYTGFPAGDYESPYDQLEKYLKDNGIGPVDNGVEEEEDLDSRFVFPYEEDSERSPYDCLSGQGAGAIPTLK